jgi:hypothetical protein
MSDRQAKIAIAAFVAAVVFILIVAFYGYVTGAWVPE